jgi:protein O-GlcNAc transferase
MAAPSIDHRLNQAVEAHFAGRFAQAESGYREVLLSRPQCITALKGLGIIEFLAGNKSEAVALFRRATEQDPEDAEAWVNLANAARAIQDSETSFSAAREALARVPNEPMARTCEAAALMAWGYQAEAVAAMHAAALAHPTRADLLSMWLFYAGYDSALDDTDLRDAHGLFGRGFPALNRPSLPRQIKRIGMVSGDFKRHPVGRFVQPLFRAFNRNEFELFAYGNEVDEDEVTGEIRANASGYLDLTGLTDEAAARRIREDELDLLVDLSGHTAGNRLGIFALRPAPIQATFLGYSGTTGLPAMDFLIADSVTVPAGAESLYHERIARLDRTLYCWPYLPPVTEESDEPRNGFVFGSTNNLAKISSATLDTWAQILARATHAELWIKAPTLDMPPAQAYLIERLQQRGVDLERVRLFGYLDPQMHEAFQRSVDVLLDSYPYGGATTTLDALRNRTPVLTQTGSRYTSRMSASILQSADLGDWITDSAESFINQAVEIASNPACVAAVRAHLRENLSARPLFDQEGFARSFEATCRGMLTQLQAESAGIIRQPSAVSSTA